MWKVATHTWCNREQQICLFYFYFSVSALISFGNFHVIPLTKICKAWTNEKKILSKRMTSEWWEGFGVSCARLIPVSDWTLKEAWCAKLGGVHCVPLSPLCFPSHHEPDNLSRVHGPFAQHQRSSLVPSIWMIINNSPRVFQIAVY